jgi:nucleoid DNA-binding protein
MTLTRSRLRAALQVQGFSYREARAIVSVIFEVLTEALKKNGTLELPFGSLTLCKARPKRQYRLGKIVRSYNKPQVHFRRKD